jgi:hypothetical protein
LQDTAALMTDGHRLSNSLYRPQFERDNCGFGLIANIDGQASHWLVDTAIKALERPTGAPSRRTANPATAAGCC